MLQKIAKCVEERTKKRAWNCGAKIFEPPLKNLPPMTVNAKFLEDSFKDLLANNSLLSLNFKT